MELTLEYVIKNNLTPLECVRFFDKDISEEEADFIIWEKTCFPFSNESFINQLNDIFRPEKLSTEKITKG